MKSLRRFIPAISAFVKTFRKFWVIPVFAFMTLECHLFTEGKGDTLISFTHMYDSLKQYDSVTIVMKNLNGDILDILFRGKVNQVDDIQNLRAPHWDGGKVMVSITGKKRWSSGLLG